MSAHISCHTLRRVLVRHSTLNLTTGATTPTGQEWTTRACDVPLFSDAERASGVCRSCASGWTHPENHPLVPVFDAAAHARFSLRHWQAMQEQAAAPADLARATKGVAVWSARVATLAHLATPLRKNQAPRLRPDAIRAGAGSSASKGGADGGCIPVRARPQQGASPPCPRP